VTATTTLVIGAAVAGGGEPPVLPPDPLDQSHLYLDEDQSRGIEGRRDIVAGTGRAGTLYLSDTRAFHRAKPVVSGVRRVLWNYFA